MSTPQPATRSTAFGIAAWLSAVNTFFCTRLAHPIGVVIVFFVVTALFWLSDSQRLRDAAYVARLGFLAESLTPPKPEVDPLWTHEIVARLAAPKSELRPVADRAGLAIRPKYEITQIEATSQIRNAVNNLISTHTASSQEHNRAVSEWAEVLANDELLYWLRSEAPSDPPVIIKNDAFSFADFWGFLDCWRNDRWKYSPVTLGTATLDLDATRRQAEEFKNWGLIFKDWHMMNGREWRMVPSGYWLQPHSLFRFADGIRYELSRGLPIALASGFLALGLLARLAEEKHNFGGKQGKVSIWKNEPDLRTRTGYWITAGIVLGLFIELVLNRPATRLEWLVNIPFSVVSGVCLVLIIRHLWALRRVALHGSLPKATINSALRCLLMACFCIAIGIGWALLFSSSYLLFSSQLLQVIRAVVQILLVLLITVFAISVYRHLHDQVVGRVPDTDAGAGAIVERSINSMATMSLSLLFPVAQVLTSIIGS